MIVIKMNMTNILSRISSIILYLFMDLLLPCFEFRLMEMMMIWMVNQVNETLTIETEKNNKISLDDFFSSYFELKIISSLIMD